jgi:cystathionine gamma-synthase
MNDSGGMISILLESAEAAQRMVSRTKLFALAESLGGVESLIEHPYSMTHASTATSPIAVPPELVRLSVGIEHEND